MKYCKALFLFTGLLLSVYSFEQNTEGKFLKDVYKDAFLTGTAVTPAITSGSDKATQDIVVKHFSSITVENVMKAALINPLPGKYEFGPADDFVAFGKKHHLFIVGHTLVWHNQCPDWFLTNADGQPNSREQQIERLRQLTRVDLASIHSGLISCSPARSNN
jgi:endo-1,4-beta-xylanase